MFGCLQLVCGVYYLWCRINWSGDEIFIGWPGILPRIYISLTSVSCYYYNYIAINLIKHYILLVVCRRSKDSLLSPTERNEPWLLNEDC